ncbi:NADH-quinone oxidoreductase subunit N [Fimbriimonas ginsengisoli]|uniref:NADH-quinone oxidoreductase subunit N n=1 Tax=Fimbriimonas ginsengisoli Gsoil 348 TaxID=661478 RepID=A0A068NKZ2_FIMGI|nr:NADH-quinone oxidoreductase subunit N [Fimbriimonas ginsengisoli]AIE84072.1 proton-translocating NADH-quinone oxidoreductase, chain N [Fimbriimonas ginsengisoli Gsoil 348]
MNPPFMFPVPEADLFAILPVVIVMLTGILALIVEMARPKHNNDAIVAISLLGLAVAGFLAFRNLGDLEFSTFSDTYLVDRFGSIMQIVIVLGTLLSIVFSEGYLRNKRIPFGEFYPLMLWSSTGAMIMASTKNLLVIFVGLEILSVALYVMAGMSRTEEKSSESALKYFLLGAFASGFLLYGISFLYGATGTLHLEEVARAWISGGPAARPLIVFGVGMIVIGLGFKASLVPFHQWTPDVYQGAPTNVTSFMATVSKVGAFAALVRVLDAVVVREMVGIWIPALCVLAVLTMTVGNLVALTQKDAKRILGYSSIAQAGYVLVAVIAHLQSPTTVGYGTIAYYLFGYTAMTAGAFAVLSMAAKDGKEGTLLTELNGLAKRAPFAAATLVIFIASLVGLPPTAGFWGKFQIIRDISSAGLTWLAVVLAVNSIISVYYYLSIAMAVYTGGDSVSESTPEPRPARTNLGVLGACALGLIGVLGALAPQVVNLFNGK